MIPGVSKTESISGFILLWQMNLHDISSHDYRKMRLICIFYFIKK